MKKCAMKMKERKKQRKNDVRIGKNIIDGRRTLIGQAKKTCAMDINELQVDDC